MNGFNFSTFLAWINKTIGVYNIKGFYITPTYWQAGAIVLLLFLLLFSLARLRYLYVHWHLDRTAYSMFFWGFVVALIVEGFLIVSGKTFLSAVLGWKNPPKPIARALDAGRARLIKVLGASEDAMSTEKLISDFEKLGSEESEDVKEFICKE